jgi:hypothetical protein
MSRGSYILEGFVYIRQAPCMQIIYTPQPSFKGLPTRELRSDHHWDVCPVSCKFDQLPLERLQGWGPRLVDAYALDKGQLVHA